MATSVTITWIGKEEVGEGVTFAVGVTVGVTVEVGLEVKVLVSVEYELSLGTGVVVNLAV